ncbi:MULTISPECIES: MFS transporter [unclassified Variovorax]|uniref:MFS transporter n=1 Tax=unclassified Variovorax TaxID=663243 RepID=UPI000D12FD4F|nr:MULTISPECIES: MFS transporter [unclassified Variovorax]AVQ82110.1 MFS transporter [Variovorax sp. PMC12]QRY33630.1 MFS transporter [Variovorax sp. PDNC026]
MKPIGPRRAARQFPAFLFSLLVSKLADQILLFLVPLVVFQVTQDVAWSGYAFAAETFPRFLSFPVCGALCDRISPIRLLRGSQVFRALVCVLGVLGNEALGGIGWLVGLSAVCGVLTTQGVMAREVMLPQIAGNGHGFDKVLAYAQTAEQTGMVLGPLVAAALFAFLPWQAVVGAAAALFLLADVATAYWRRGNPMQLHEPQAAKGHLLQPIKTALGHLLHLPGLLRLTGLTAGVNLMLGTTLASSAAMVTGLHHRSATYYAWLQTLGAVATIAILLSIIRGSFALKKMGLTAYLLIFGGGLLTAVSTSHWGYAAGFLLVIGFDKMFSIYIRIHRQRIIPAHDYGKTTGVIVLLNNLTQPLAGLLVGAFADAAQTRMVIFGLCMLVGAIGIAAALASRSSSATAP